MRVHVPALALILLAAPVRAQEIGPAEWRERVAHIDDAAELRQLADADDAFAAAFAELRLWELTGDREYAHDSRRRFDDIAEREPHNAWAHYGHALALRADIESDNGFLAADDAFARAFGYDALSRARRALERAVAIDPTLPGAAALLTQYAIETEDGSALAQARDSFADQVAAGNDTDAMLLGLAAAERAMEDYDAAADAAARVAARGGPSFARAHFEFAISLAALPDREAEAGHAYMTALEAADDSLLDVMWRDARIIATDAEVEKWEAADDVAEKRLRLRDMWDVRGALSGHTAEQRVAEHYRRMAIARDRFRRHGRLGAAPRNALRWGFVDRRFDDRGVIYIRHGEPLHTYDHGALHPYTVWFYDGTVGERLSFHFYRFEGEPGYSRDWVLMRTLPCPLDTEVASWDPRLRPLTVSCSSQRVVSRELQQEAERALTYDSDRPHYTATTPFTFDWYTFRGAGGSTDVALAIALPLHELPPGERTMRMAAAVVDTVTNNIRRAEGTAAPVIRTDDPTQLLRGQLTLNVPPASDAVYRVSVNDVDDADVGMMYGGTIDLRDYTGDTLMVSDVVLAEQRDGGAFARGDQRLVLAPTQSFRGGEFRVYYEVYHLPAGAAYRTELTVERTDRGLLDTVRGWFGGDDAVRLSFDEVAPDEGANEIRQLRDVTAPLEPGDYVLRVRISADDAQITRERRFTIPER